MIEEQLLTLSEARLQTEGLIRQTLLGAPSSVLEMTGYLSGAPGKGIRTLLLIYCAMNDASLVSKDAVQAAAAIELFHLATLIHDDVIDDAPLRRGIPTIQSKFGKKQAVICGDLLLCLAASLVTPLHAKYQENAGILTAFAAALKSVCLGELNQFRNNRNLELKTTDYLRIVSGKTASLFYVSALSGALIARLANEQAMRLARFGRYLGMAFQIVDDCMDYEFSDDATLKTAGKDIIEGVVTLPLIYSIKNSPQLRELANQAFLDFNAAKMVVQAVLDANGIQQSRGVASRYADKARTLLCDFPSANNCFLLELLETVVNQSHRKGF